MNEVRHSCECRKMEKEEGSSENGSDLRVKWMLIIITTMYVTQLIEIQQQLTSVHKCTSYTPKMNSGIIVAP